MSAGSTLTVQLLTSIGPRATARLMRDFGGRTIRVPRLQRHPTSRLGRDLAILALLDTPSTRRPGMTTVNAPGGKSDEIETILARHKQDLLETIAREQRRAERVAY